MKNFVAFTLRFVRFDEFKIDEKKHDRFQIEIEHIDNMFVYFYFEIFVDLKLITYTFCIHRVFVMRTNQTTTKTTKRVSDCHILD